MGSSRKLRESWLIESIFTYLKGVDSRTLLKSIFSNLPTYFLSLFLLPAGVANQIEMLFHAFLWDGMGEATMFHLIIWNKVCTPISFGGLGVRES